MRSYIVIAALALSLSAQAKVCSWDNPGASPANKAHISTQLARYSDLPTSVKQRLAEKIDKRNYDGVVVVTRDGLDGPYTRLRDMQWSTGMCRGPVSRSKWSADHTERGLVFTEGPYSVVVMTVCGNMARLDIAGGGGGGSDGGGGGSGFRGDLPGIPPAAIVDTPAMTEISEQHGGSSTVIEASAPNYGRSDSSTVMSNQGWSGGSSFSSGISTTIVFASGGGSYVVNNITNTSSSSTNITNVTNPPAVPAPTPAVPEPETWALMLCGLAAIVFKAKRRNNE